MPNNYWDDPFGPSDPPSDSSTNYWDDPFGLNAEAPYRGLPQDDWTPEYQKSEGWDSLFDNPVIRGAENAGALAASSIFGVGSAALDLFDTVTNSKLAYTGPIGAFVDLPQDKDEELTNLIDKNKQTSLSGAASDIFGDVSNMFGEAAANVSTKKDSNGGMIEELKGDIASGSPWEATKDIAGFGVDMLAGLGGMAAAGGPSTALKGAGSAIGAGMALDVYGDTYAELTKNEDDSRLLAVTAAAANAGVQGVLEKIGWEVAVGKTVFGQWFKDSATASAKRMIGARILLTVPTEGMEETGQQMSDILAKRLPEARAKGWDTVLEEIANDAVTQLPEAAFSGALGGLLLGGGGATLESLMGRKGAADVAARNGGLPHAPEDQLANAIDKPTSEEKAKDALLDAVEEVGGLAGGGDLSGVFTDQNLQDNDVVPTSEVVKQEKVKKLSKKARAAKEAADQAIKDLALDAEKQRAELANGTTSSDIDAAGERITRSIETVVAEKQAQVDDVMSTVQYMTQLLQGTQPTFNTGAEGEQETVQAPQIQATPEEVASVIQMKAQEHGLEIPIEAIQNPVGFDWGSWGQQQVAQAKETVVEGLKGPVDAIRSSITVEPDSPMASVLTSIPEPTVELPEPIYEDESVSYRQLRFARLRGMFKQFIPDVKPMEMSLPAGVARGTKVIPGVSNNKSTVLPKYEASNTLTKNFNYNNENPAITSAGRELGNWLRGEVLQVLPESKYTDSEKGIVIENTKNIVESERQALNVMPAMKRIIFNVWQTAPAALVERLGNALTHTNDADVSGLAREVANHIASHGLFSDVAGIIESNPAAMERFTASLIHAGKGVMSPWSMERIMLETGVDYRSAKAGVAAMSTMAERWAMKNGKDIFEWWDRIGDYARVAQFRTGTAPYGTAQGSSPSEIEGLKKANQYIEFGKGIITLFKVKKAPGVRVALHESIHMLHTSGLMREMLDQEAQNAMEDLVGEKLWDQDGEPLRISAVGAERMAVGFEKFIYENDAPNARVRAAFDDVKQWFANYFKRWFESLGVAEHLAGPAMYASVSVYGKDGDPVHLKLGDMDIDAPQARAFYQLLNANPDGTEIAYSSPGIATAVENLITDTTGIDAKGVLTYQPPAQSLVTLPVFPKDRVVTTDDLPDAEDAANTKWFHGSGKESLHTLGFDSSFSAIGLVGTGVYFTDNPAVAKSYMDASSRGSGYFKGAGEVYAVKVAPRNVINLEEPIDANVSLIIQKAINDVASKIDNYVATKYPNRGYLKAAYDNAYNKFFDLQTAHFEEIAKQRMDKGIQDGVPYTPSNMKISMMDVVAAKDISDSFLDKLQESNPFVRASKKLRDHAAMLSNSGLEGYPPTFDTAIMAIMGLGNVALGIPESTYSAAGVSPNSIFSGIESGLRSAGYDAYTHIGGITTNQKIKHRVLVLMDPEAKLGSGYPKIDMRAWPTVNINPEQLEDDWSIHEPNGPSDSQWRRMIGLTNDESNGTHTHATLLEMAKDRERVSDLAKRTNAQEKAEPARPAESRASVAREVLSSVGDGILEGETLIEDMLKHQHDTIMNGGRDGFNSGVSTDPTKVDQVKDMLNNFTSKMRSWAYLTAQGDFARVGKELGRGALYALVKPMHASWKFLEGSIGDNLAEVMGIVQGLSTLSKEEEGRLRSTGGEAAVKERMAQYELLNMPSLAKMINNHHALSKLADKVAELRPQLYDMVKHMPVPIPGARSFNEILTTFNRMAEAYYSANKNKLPYKDSHEAHEGITRDLRLWMFSARQFELVDRVKEDMAKYEADLAAWEKASKALKKNKPKKGDVLQELEQPDKPQKPKLPQITEEGTMWAENVKMLLEMRYGKSLAILKATAQELTQWENHMVLDKLLNVKMITAKEHADMYAKGKHHIPMYRVRRMLDQSGVLNTRLDDSMYKVLDYLKHDISMKMEDPINAMLRKAAGIEMLTMRQHVKNTLGERIKADVRWWDTDYKDSPLSILHKKEAITKDEFDELARSGKYQVTSAVKHRKDDQGNRIESGHTYYKHVPFTAEDVESGLKYATNPSVLRALKKTESQVRSDYEQKMFAFYPEPGKPMYVSIHDPAAARAFFYLNNQQAAWADSFAGRWFSKIDGMHGKQEEAELQAKVAYHANRILATGYFGFNKVARSLITSNPAFVFNALFRDLAGAKIRSRAGLRWVDIPGGFVESMALMFPSMMEVFPEKFDVARDAAQGMATFSGLSASNADGSLDADILMSLTRGRGEMMDKAKKGSYPAIAGLMWNDMKQFFAKEGLTTAPGQMWSEMKRKKNIGKHLIAIAKSPISVAVAAGQFAGTITENATRLTERGLLMSEDMSKYPSLVAHYDPAKAINGKILAGFTGTIHRAKWQAAKLQLQANPNYKVPEDAMPVQTNLTERDNAMSHVTVHFPQKGYWSTSINQMSLFYNPMAQDLYSNLKILSKHSALQKATAYALGEDWKAAKDQVKLNSAAYAWIIKSLFYTTLPMMMMMASYGGDDDDSLDWQSQSAIEKMSYYWIPTNKIGLTERPLRLASGLGLFSLMFKDLPMAGMLEAQGKDPKAMQKWFRRFFDSTPFGAVGIPVMDGMEGGWKPALMSVGTKSIPLLAPESINPIVELAMDRQQFRDKAIAFPQDLAREDPTEVQREKYNILTNTVTKALSSLRLQPAQVQYLISRYFTGSSRWLPIVANKAMELSHGAEGVNQDVQSSNSPLANQSAGFWPRTQARESYGIGNEFVQDLLTTARESAEQRKSYESMNETRKPGYLAEHKLIQEDIYFGKRGADGYRSGGLQAAAKKVIEWERSKKEALKAGRIDKVEALLLEKQYTLFAMEAMRNVMYQIGE